MKTDHSLGKKVRQAIRLDRAIGFVWQASPNWTLASLVLLVLQGTLPLLALYVMKLIIDAVAFSLTAPDKVAAFWNIGLLIIAAAGVALLNAFLQLMASPALYPKIVLDIDFAMLYLLWAWKHKIKSNGHCRDRNPSSIF